MGYTTETYRPKPTRGFNECVISGVGGDGDVSGGISHVVIYSQCGGVAPVVIRHIGPSRAKGLQSMCRHLQTASSEGSFGTGGKNILLPGVARFVLLAGWGNCHLKAVLKYFHKFSKNIPRAPDCDDDNCDKTAKRGRQEEGGRSQ